MDLVQLDQAIMHGRLDHWSYEHLSGLLCQLPRPQLMRFARLLKRGVPVRSAVVAARNDGSDWLRGRRTRSRRGTATSSSRAGAA